MNACYINFNITQVKRTGELKRILCDYIKKCGLLKPPPPFPYDTTINDTHFSASISGLFNIS